MAKSNRISCSELPHLMYLTFLLVFITNCHTGTIGTYTFPHDGGNPLTFASLCMDIQRIGQWCKHTNLCSPHICTSRKCPYIRSIEGFLPTLLMASVALYMQTKSKVYRHRVSSAYLLVSVSKQSGSHNIVFGNSILWKDYP